MESRRRRPKSAFALIELLVVIAILAALRGAREKGKQAVHMYLQDWDDYLPFNSNGACGVPHGIQAWPQVLWPTYIKDSKIFVCPSKPKKVGISNWTNCYSDTNGGIWITPATSPDDPSEWKIKFRHTGSANACFLDGHVAAVQWKASGTSYWVGQP